MCRLVRPALLAAALAALPACQTAENAAETTREGVVDAADAAGDAAVTVAGAADTAFDESTGAVEDVARAAYDEARDVLGVSRVSDDARVAVARVGAPADTSTGVSGTVTFVELSDGVRVRYDLAGLTPGRHGLHVHQTGSCAAADADGDGYAEAGGAAGPHLNPGDDPHGPLDADMDEKHAGDLGNVDAGADGRVTGAKTTGSLAFSGDRTVLGRAVIVHADPDEFMDAGAMAGGRVGCGVIAETDRM